MTRDELITAGLCIGCQKEKALRGELFGKLCNMKRSRSDGYAMRGIHLQLARDRGETLTRHGKTK